MSNLRVKNLVAVDSILVDEGRAVLTEVVEYFDDPLGCQNLLQIVLQFVVKGVYLQHIK